jgi:hypothetical protein
MDITELTTFLSPFLPFLLDLTEHSPSQHRKKAENIWGQLQPQVNARPDVKAALEQVAAKPASQARRAVLQEELEALFADQPELLATIAQIMKNDDGNVITQVQQTISGGVVFNITDTTIGNLAGSGNIYTQEVSLSSGPSAQVRSKTILILSANPKGTTPLRLAEEVRELQCGLERSRHRDEFRLEQRSAVTTRDLRRALIDCRPQVVHFSGHGVGQVLEDTPADSRKLNAGGVEGLVLEDEAGQIQLVSGEAIAQLFAIFANDIECVVLNACYSEVQAQQIVQHIPYVIGMKQAIGDRAAIEFAIGFYDGLLGGRSVKDAYQLGCNAIKMAGILEDLTPILLSDMGGNILQ